MQNIPPNLTILLPPETLSKILVQSEEPINKLTSVCKKWNELIKNFPFYSLILFQSYQTSPILKSYANRICQFPPTNDDKAEQLERIQLVYNDLIIDKKSQFS